MVEIGPVVFEIFDQMWCGRFESPRPPWRYFYCHCRCRIGVAFLAKGFECVERTTCRFHVILKFVVFVTFPFSIETCSTAGHDDDISRSSMCEIVCGRKSEFSSWETIGGVVIWWPTFSARRSGAKSTTRYNENILPRKKLQEFLKYFLIVQNERCVRLDVNQAIGGYVFAAAWNFGIAV